MNEAVLDASVVLKWFRSEGEGRVDANVRSEATKPDPNELVVEWLRRNESEVAVDPIILGEVRLGILLLPGGRRRNRLERWFDEGARRLQCVPWDAATGLRWAELLAELPLLALGPRPRPRRPSRGGDREWARGRAMPIKDSMMAEQLMIRPGVAGVRRRSQLGGGAPARRSARKWRQSRDEISRASLRWLRLGRRCTYDPPAAGLARGRRPIRGGCMAIAVYFHPKGMSLAQFQETHSRLAAVGSAEPDGRIHHSCFGNDGDLMVYDIWESSEKFEAFGGVLMPILGEIGIDVGEPSIMALHRLDQASAKQDGA